MRKHFSLASATFLLWFFSIFSAQAAVVIYDDSVASGWTTTSSWGVGLHPSAVSPSPYQGSYSLQAIYSQAWGTVRFTNNAGASTNGNTALTLAFHKYDSGTTPLEKALYVVLYDTNGNQLGVKEVKPYTPGGLPVAANTWHKIIIPLSDLGAAGMTVKYIDLQSETLYTLFFDEIKFEQDAVIPPPSLDSDSDGLSDVADNCPFVQNALQTDTDGNGIGDACDLVQNETKKPKISSISPNTGVSGDEISLFGKNFGPAPGEIFVGGISVALQVWTDAFIKFALPDLAPGKYKIELDFCG